MVTRCHANMVSQIMSRWLGKHFIEKRFAIQFPLNKGAIPPPLSPECW